MVKGAKAVEGDLATAGEEGSGKLASGVSSGLSKLTGALGTVFPPLQGLSDKFDQFSQHAESASTKTTGTFDSLAHAGGLAFAGLGIAAVGVGIAGVVMAEKFQSATSSIAANAGISQDAATKIGNAFLTTAGTTEFSGTEMSTAYAGVAAQLGQLEGHALNSQQALEFMKVAMDLATGSGTSLGNATKDLGTAMQAFHISSSQAVSASDALFNASRLTGNGIDTVTATFTKMRSTLGDVTPPIGQLGGLMVDLANHGETGRKALSAVNTALNGILAPSASATAAQAALGTSFFDSTGKFVGMGAVIGELQPKLEGMSQEQQLATLKAVGFGTANKAMLETVLAGPAAFDKATSAVERHGSAAAAAAIKGQTLPVQLKTLEATGTDLATAIGTKLIPVLEKIGTVILGTVKFFEQHKAAAIALGIVIGTVLVAAMGAFVISLFSAEGAIGGMAVTLYPLIGGMLGFDAAATGADIALAPFILTIGLVVAGIAILGVAIYELVTHWSQVWGEVKRIAEDVWKFLTHTWDSIYKDIMGAWGTIVGFFKQIWPAILIIFTGGVALIPLLLIKYWSQITNDIHKAWSDIINFFTGIPKAILGALSSFGDLILGWITDAITAVATFVHTAWSNEINFWSALPGRVINAVSAFGGMILGWITNGLTAVYNFIVGALEQQIAFWTGLPGRILSALGDAVGLLLGWGEGVINGLWHGVTAAWDAIGNVGAIIRGWFTGALSDAVNWLENVGSAIIQGLVNGVRNSAHLVTDAIHAVVSTVKSVVTLGGLIGSPSPWFTEVGHAIGQGLTNGITGSHGMVSSATGGLADAVKSAQFGFTGPTGGGVGMGSGANSVNITLAAGAVQINGLNPNSAQAASTAVSDGLLILAEKLGAGQAPTRVGASR